MVMKHITKHIRSVNKYSLTNFVWQFMTQDCNGGGYPPSDAGTKGSPNGHAVQEGVQGVPNQDHDS